MRLALEDRGEAGETREEQEMRDLERSHPGIGSVDRDPRGAIVVPGEDGGESS